jgi:hypothetical protein
MRRWLLVFPPWLKSMTEPPVPDYEAQAREADAIADKAAPGSRIEGGYRILAEDYRSLARVAARARQSCRLANVGRLPRPYNCCASPRVPAWRVLDLSFSRR